MSDNKSKTAADRKRINVHDRQELHYWSHRFGISPEELKRVVSKAGVMADDVARVLGKLWLLKYIHRRTTLHSEPRSNRARARFFQKWMLVGAWRVSALGHSRTNSAARAMSALPPKSRHFALSEQCPLRTISGQFFVNGNELRGCNFSITDGWSICNSTGGAVAFWKPTW